MAIHKLRIQVGAKCENDLERDAIATYSELDSTGQNVAVYLYGGDYPEKYSLGTYAISDLDPDYDETESAMHNVYYIYIHASETSPILEYVHNAAAWYAVDVASDFNNYEVEYDLQNGESAFRAAFRWLANAIKVNLEETYEYGDNQAITYAWIDMYPDKWKALLDKVTALEVAAITARRQAELALVLTSSEVCSMYAKAGKPLKPYLLARWVEEGLFKAYRRSSKGQVAIFHRDEVAEVMASKGYELVQVEAVVND